MNKKNYVWFVVIILVLILGIWLLASKSSQDKVLNNQPAQVPAGQQSPVGEANATPVKTIGMGEGFEVQFMTAAEKEAQGFKTEDKVQVLQRNSEGVVALSRLILSDADLVNSQEELDALINPTPAPATSETAAPAAETAPALNE
jgi:hypothetical protein